MPAIKSDPTLTEPTTYDSDGEEPPSNVVVSEPVSEPTKEQEETVEKPKKVSKKGSVKA
jgi:hypothetical protein